MNVLGKMWDLRNEKRIMEKNGFEVPGGGVVSGDGVWVGGVGKFPENRRVVR